MELFREPVDSIGEPLELLLRLRVEVFREDAGRPQLLVEELLRAVQEVATTRVESVEGSLRLLSARHELTARSRIGLGSADTTGRCWSDELRPERQEEPKETDTREQDPRDDDDVR